jgi:hypothetical protein
MEDERYEIPACLKPTLCPNCAYSFDGLPAGGVCPECGRSRDADEVVFYGWGRGRHESVGTARRSRIAWVSFLSAFWLFIQSWQYFFLSKLDRLYLTMMWLPMLAIWAYAIFNRSETRHPGQVQVRLTKEGCVQYSNLNGPSFLSQMMFAYGWVAVLAISIALLVSFWRGKMGALQFWIWFPIAMGATVGLWYGNRKFRWELAKVREGSLADANAPYRKVCPWSKVSEFSLIRSRKDGLYRLKMEGGGSFFTMYPVDAEIVCTEEQAAELRKFMAVHQVKRDKSEVDWVLQERIRQWKKENEEAKLDRPTGSL